MALLQRHLFSGDTFMAMAEIGMGLTSLKTAFDIAKAMKDIHDATTLNSKIIDLQSAIMDAQSSAITAREVHASQIGRIREIEEEIARLKAWERQKQNYELKQLGVGSLAYALKPEVTTGEPPHWLCANCYNHGKKAFLQLAPEWAEVLQAYLWVCPICATGIYVGYKFSPNYPWEPGLQS